MDYIGQKKLQHEVYIIYISIGWNLHIQPIFTHKDKRTKKSEKVKVQHTPRVGTFLQHGRLCFTPFPSVFFCLPLHQFPTEKPMMLFLTTVYKKKTLLPINALQIKYLCFPFDEIPTKRRLLNRKHSTENYHKIPTRTTILFLLSAHPKIYRTCSLSFHFALSSFSNWSTCPPAASLTGIPACPPSPRPFEPPGGAFLRNDAMVLRIKKAKKKERLIKRSNSKLSVIQIRSTPSVVNDQEISYKRGRAISRQPARWYSYVHHRSLRRTPKPAVRPASMYTKISSIWCCTHNNTGTCWQLYCPLQILWETLPGSTHPWW